MTTPGPSHQMTALERLKLTRGEEVTIYVGPEKKKYRLPKRLLCATSTYFDRCFNGEFTEGQNQELTLEEDNVEHFEILLEYIFAGRVGPKTLTIETKPRHVECGQEILELCMEFISYADKYDLKDAGFAIYDSARHALCSSNRNKNDAWIKQSHVRFFFKKYPAGSLFRDLIMDAVVSHWGADKLHKFKSVEDEVDGYAQELLVRIRACNYFRGHWVDPLKHVHKESLSW